MKKLVQMLMVLCMVIMSTQVVFANADKTTIAEGADITAVHRLAIVQPLGVDPIHFAAIMGVNLAMGGVTPPYASILYLAMRIGNCSFQDILGPTLAFLIFGYVPVVFLTTFWPPLSLYVPRLLGY